MKKGGGMFKVGDKVVCINRHWWNTNGTEQFKLLPIEGEIYTISFFETLKSSQYIGLLEMPQSDMYWINEFRKLDHAFGSETAERIEQEINESILIEK